MIQLLQNGKQFIKTKMQWFICDVKISSCILQYVLFKIFQKLYFKPNSCKLMIIFSKNFDMQIKSLFFRRQFKNGPIFDLFFIIKLIKYVIVMQSKVIDNPVCLIFYVLIEKISILLMFLKYIWHLQYNKYWFVL